MTIITRLAEIKIRLDRGSSLLYWMRNILIIVSGLKFMLDLDVTLTIILGVIVTIIIYFLGWLDLNKIKLYQVEAQLTTGKYNPYFKNLKKKKFK